jgi:hypothetical protein
MNRSGFIGIVAAIFIGLFAFVAGAISGYKNPGLFKGPTIADWKTPDAG